VSRRDFPVSRGCRPQGEIDRKIRIVGRNDARGEAPRCIKKKIGGPPNRLRSRMSALPDSNFAQVGSRELLFDTEVVR